MKETNYSERLCCSPEVKKRIMIKCKQEFLKHHPEMIGLNLTENFMLDKISVYYMENG